MTVNLRVSLDHPAGGLGLTYFYQELLAAVRRLPSFTEDAAVADVVFPAEDTSLETNWPRYARAQTAFVRGRPHKRLVVAYLKALRFSPHRLCVVNMRHSLGVPTWFVERPDCVVADINLLVSDRRQNPSTISMPALPITVGRFDPTAKHRLACFRGVNSHPVRERLRSLASESGFVCEIVEPANHCGKLDASQNTIDQVYYDLLNESHFALIPRGDAHFSYRLLEALSFGCIPVVLSDDLILPFDRVVPWADFSLHMREAAVATIPDRLRSLSSEQITAMQRLAAQSYENYFSDFDKIVASLLAEIALIRRTEASGVKPRGFGKIKRLLAKIAFRHWLRVKVWQRLKDRTT